MVSVAFHTLALGLLVLGLRACGVHREETPAVGAIGAAIARSPDGRWSSWGEDGRIWIARSDTTPAGTALVRVTLARQRAEGWARLPRNCG